MHSPVWPDYDPTFDTAEVWSDWDYYSDDYYDEGSPRKKRKVNDAENNTAEQDDVGSGLRRKRRKLHLANEIPDLCLGDSLHLNLDDGKSVPPVVVWKSKIESTDTPVVSEGQEEKVTLLKDWRERFRIPSQASPHLSKGDGFTRRGSQRAVAVVIDQKTAGNSTKMNQPTTSSSKNPGIPSRTKFRQPHTIRIATTASSAAKQRQKVSETLKHAPATHQAHKPSTGQPAPARSENKAPPNRLKRKAYTVIGNDTGSGIVKKASKGLDSSKLTETTHGNGPLQEETAGRSTTTERPQKRGRPKAGTPIPPVISKGTTRNMEIANIKDAVLEPLPNGNVTSKGIRVTNANTSKHVQPETSKGSLRKRKAEDLQNDDAERSSKRNVSGLRGRAPRFV